MVLLYQKYFKQLAAYPQMLHSEQEDEECDHSTSLPRHSSGQAG